MPSETRTSLISLFGSIVVHSFSTLPRPGYAPGASWHSLIYVGLISDFQNSPTCNECERTTLTCKDLNSSQTSQHSKVFGPGAPGGTPSRGRRRPVVAINVAIGVGSPVADFCRRLGADGGDGRRRREVRPKLARPKRGPQCAGARLVVFQGKQLTSNVKGGRRVRRMTRRRVPGGETRNMSSVRSMELTYHAYNAMNTGCRVACDVACRQRACRASVSGPAALRPLSSCPALPDPYCLHVE